MGCLKYGPKVPPARRQTEIVAGHDELLYFIEIEPFKRFQRAIDKPGSYGPHDLASSQRRRRHTGL